MARYELVIPNWIPVSDNQLTGCHWGTKNRLKKNDKDLVGYYFLASRIPQATSRRRASVALYKPRLQGDPANILKSCLDALTACHAICDDSPKWLELGEVTMERGPRRTVITLEDV